MTGDLSTWLALPSVWTISCRAAGLCRKVLASTLWRCDSELPDIWTMQLVAVCIIYVCVGLPNLIFWACPERMKSLERVCSIRAETLSSVEIVSLCADSWRPCLVLVHECHWEMDNWFLWRSPGTGRSEAALLGESHWRMSMIWPCCWNWCGLDDSPLEFVPCACSTHPPATMLLTAGQTECYATSFAVNWAGLGPGYPEAS